MKNYFLMLFIVLIPFLGIGQLSNATFMVDGIVTDLNGNPIPNHPVTIYTDSTSPYPPYTQTVFTNNSGGYADTFFYSLFQGTLYIGTANCNGNAIVTYNSYSTTPGSVVFINKNFQICGGPNQCQSAFSYTLQGNTLQTTNLSSYGPNAGVKCIWSLLGPNGNDTSFVSNSATFNNLSPFATYTLCLAIEDTINICADTHCATIQSTSCNAYFVANTLNPNNFCEWTFDLVSMGGAFSVSWNFGDGTSVSGNTAPTHTYTSSGPQTVICTLLDSLGNICDTSQVAIVVQGCGNNGANVNGYVYKPTSSGNSWADADVYLIEFDPALGTLTAIDTTQTDPSGVYSFGGLPANNYLVKAALRSSDPDYGSYLPTYYGSVLMWNQATTITATASNVGISMLSGATYSGPGFIGGFVSQGANRISGVGDPLPNHLVLLTTAADQPMGFVYTDVNGQYSFAGLPYGTYKIWIDVLNSVCDPLIVSINSGSSTINDADFEVNSTYVTGIYHPSLASGFEVYPNPAQDKLFIDIKDNAQANLSVQITDIMGKVHVEAPISAPSNEISLQSLSSGYYFLVVKTENGSFVQKIVKQ